MCVNNYFSPEMRSLMKHGVFLWHEGFTPEYRGLYSPFWAVHNLDFEHLGYTLLRMNDRLDAGEVYAQGRASGVDPRRDLHAYIGHKAIADSLPDVERFLQELEAGTAEPLERPNAVSGYYTYPGLSDFVRQRVRIRRADQAATATP
jgi:methionyl-tRNA formyltransferase